MTGAPITGWQACRCCRHGRLGGLYCAHPVAVAADGAPASVEVVRRSAHLCTPHGHWHEYRAPAGATGVAARHPALTCDAAA